MIGFAILALVQGLLVRVFAIPSSSMMETLNPRDRVIVNLRAYDSAGPQRGDIVVFRHGDTWDADRKPPADSVVVNAARDVGDFLGIRPSNYNYTVKRVLAVGGDTASCCDQAGRVLVNDEPLESPTSTRTYHSRPGRWTAPPSNHRCAASPRSRYRPTVCC